MLSAEAESKNGFSIRFIDPAQIEKLLEDNNV